MSIFQAISIQVPTSPFLSYFPDKLLYLEKDGTTIVRWTLRDVGIICCVTAGTALGTTLSGITTVSTPQIAIGLDFSQGSELWPSSVTPLATGSTLLLAGIVTDTLGGRRTYLIGSIWQLASSIYSSLAHTPVQLVIARASSGIANSFCLTSAVAIVDCQYPRSHRRNVAFACMGGGQPVGFGLGLVVGGLGTGSLGWRWSYRLASIFNILALGLAFCCLSKDTDKILWRKLSREMDWVGLVILVSSFSLFLCGISFFANGVEMPRLAMNCVMVAVGLACLILYFFYAIHQEKSNRRALIPCWLWRNSAFTATCMNVFMIWGSFNSMEQLLNFVFQEVQKLSATDAALRFLPAPVSGVIVSAIIGLSIHHMPADRILLSTILLSCLSPLLLATLRLDLSYWAQAFPTVVLNSVAADALYVTANILITDLFPRDKQGLAGAVFNTIAQIGRSCGIVATGLVASCVNKSLRSKDYIVPHSLMDGFRAASWLCFVMYGVSFAVGAAYRRQIRLAGQASSSITL